MSKVPAGECGVKDQVSPPTDIHLNQGVKENMYQDKTLVCRDCGKEFVFTAGEQEFYAEKGFQNEPTRCRECRQAHKAARNNGGAREMYDAICANCGAPTKVPFQPREDRPVYCSDCFAAMQRKLFISSNAPSLGRAFFYAPVHRKSIFQRSLPSSKGSVRTEPLLRRFCL